MDITHLQLMVDQIARNFAVPAYLVGQSSQRLEQELQRQPERPDLVVFVDGYNEMYYRNNAAGGTWRPSCASRRRKSGILASAVPSFTRGPFSSTIGSSGAVSCSLRLASSRFM